MKQIGVMAALSLFQSTDRNFVEIGLILCHGSVHTGVLDNSLFKEGIFVFMWFFSYCFFKVEVLQFRRTAECHSLETWLREGEFHLNTFKMILQR